MVERKLYLTGGVGGRHQGEAFGQPYELPNDRAYAETCAAIASIMWSWRMLLATGEVKYADLIERTLFNGFLSGHVARRGALLLRQPVAEPGRPEVLGRGGHERREWYIVACCPPNVMRVDRDAWPIPGDDGRTRRADPPVRASDAVDGGRGAASRDRVSVGRPRELDVERAPKQLRLRVPGVVHGATVERPSRRRPHTATSACSRTMASASSWTCPCRRD